MDPIPLLDLPLRAPPRVVGLGLGVYELLEPRTYRLPGLWCLHLYRWRGSVAIDGVRVPILSGHAGICPPAQRLDYVFEERAEHIFVHYQFAAGDAARVQVPALVDLGAGFERLWALLREAIPWRTTEPERASARLWEVLWQIRAIAAVASGARVDPLVRARELVELHLGEPLAASDLARQAGCSHNHLIRRFRRELGTTIVGYVRARRAERARYLLETSDAPIKAIAAEVGVADLARFNKLVRRELGAPPRTVRARALAGRPGARAVRRRSLRPA
jgi:AraC-like DNA-binding protein